MMLAWYSALMSKLEPHVDFDGKTLHSTVLLTIENNGMFSPFLISVTDTQSFVHHLPT
jgi:hypothetical protein